MQSIIADLWVSNLRSEIMLSLSMSAGLLSQWYTVVRESGLA